jgi:hypothetical protein
VYDDSSDWHTVSSGGGTEERVEGLEEDVEAALVERARAQWKGEDVGWGSPAEEAYLNARPGATDEELQQHLNANYDVDARAKLQVIYLDKTQVTDAAVATLASACPRLHYIGLDNTQVTDAAATALASACPFLKYIGLSYTQVTPSLAKCWDNYATAENKQHPIYGGTIDDFRKQLRRVTNMRRKGWPHTVRFSVLAPTRYYYA